MENRDEHEVWWTDLDALQIVGNSAYGGAVPVIFSLMEAMDELGVRPVLLATYPAVVKAAERSGWVVWEFPGIVREPRLLRDLWAAIRLARELKLRKISIVHTHTSKGGMVGRLAAQLARCEVIIHHTHGFYHSGMKPGLGRWAMKRLEWLFARLDDAQVFVNTAEVEIAVSEGIVPRSKAYVLFNGVEDPLRGGAPDCSAFRSRWGIPEDVQLVGCVARLAIEQKGTDTALKTFARLLQRVPDAWLVLVGEGEDREVVERLSEDLGVRDRVTITGHLDSAGQLYACFDACFTPSRREGQSISVLEAMACATPVVTTKIPGTLDLVLDGETGILCPVDDAESMCEALVSLLVNPAEARAMGEAGHERYRSMFTTEAFHARAVDFYKEVLGKGPFR